jgi:protoporphyrin/coproporphyrin ferrochelatase
MPNLFYAEPQIPLTRTGVLLINLGTPAAPTATAVKPFLNEFLSDQRVVELPRWLWQLILRGIVLPIRSKKSAHAYSTIWQKKGSPLLVETNTLTSALALKMPKGIVTKFAMTYGEPSVTNVLQQMKEEGVQKLLVLPLYPQYAGSSSGAALDQVWRVLMKQRTQMAVHTVPSFFNNEDYIKYMAQHIRQFWDRHERGQCLLFSFHGIPLSHHTAGDSYVQECTITVNLLVEELKLAKDEYQLAFQSRFGYSPWVGPSTQDLFVQLPQAGITKLDVICPGFVTDCLETLEEINIRGRTEFQSHGGEQFNYIPCMSGGQEWVEILTPLINKQLQCWL